MSPNEAFVCSFASKRLLRGPPPEPQVLGGHRCLDRPNSLPTSFLIGRPGSARQHTWHYLTLLLDTTISTMKKCFTFYTYRLS
jgi:hypothetical protein